MTQESAVPSEPATTFSSPKASQSCDAVGVSHGRGAAYPQRPLRSTATQRTPSSIGSSTRSLGCTQCGPERLSLSKVQKCYFLARIPTHQPHNLLACYFEFYHHQSIGCGEARQIDDLVGVRQLKSIASHGLFVSKAHETQTGTFRWTVNSIAHSIAGDLVPGRLAWLFVLHRIKSLLSFTP